MRDEDIHARSVALGAAAVLAMVAIALGLAALVWHAWLPQGDIGPNAKLDFALRGAVLQSAPQDDRAAYFAEKNALISQVQWLDREHGLARIPVQDAMRILAGQAASQTRKEKP